MEYIDDFNLPDTFWIKKWIITIFINCLSFENTIRIWDYFLSSDIFSILKVAIAIMEIHQDDIFEFEMEDFSKFLNDLGKS